MTESPDQLEPVPELVNYKITSLLRDYLDLLQHEPANEETIAEIFEHINDYTHQLKQIRIQNREQTTQEVFKAIDGFFDAAPEDNKKDISCKAGCTACCYVEIDVTSDEVASILQYCAENEIEVDAEYLKQQVAAGRSHYSDVSRCVFLKESLCRVYPVRPVACRKHFVKTDPANCDTAKNPANKIARYFHIDTEILASALLNVEEPTSFGKALLNALENPAEK